MSQPVPPGQNPDHTAQTASLRTLSELDANIPRRSKQRLALASRGHAALWWLKGLGIFSLILASCTFSAMYLTAIEPRTMPFAKLFLIAYTAFYIVCGVLLWVGAELTARGYRAAAPLSLSMLAAFAAVFGLNAVGNISSAAETPTATGPVLGAFGDFLCFTLVGLAILKYWQLLKDAKG